MRDDSDLVEANHALLVLRQARLSKHAAAALMVSDLAEQAANTESQSPEIEDARATAKAAIATLAEALNAGPFAPPATWKAALSAVESWLELLK